MEYVLHLLQATVVANLQYYPFIV
uniref:Uncharacterized protein n=1 Tax=Anguilla anguilla TaxID=7936 RepID=A0A0E9UMI0_ANGAN